MSEGLKPGPEAESEVSFKDAVEMFLGVEDSEDGMLDENTHIEGYLLMCTEDALKNIGADYPGLPSSWAECDDNQKAHLREVFEKNKAEIERRWKEQLSDSEIQLNLPGDPKVEIEESDAGLEMKVTYK